MARSGAALLLAFCSWQSPARAEVGYSDSPESLVVSFREIWPELAEQDPTPLVRVYGDGRVVVHLAAYMKRSGVHQMWLPKPELEALLATLTPVLVAFDEKVVAALRDAAEAELRARAVASGEPELFHVADAEISVFRLAVDSFRPPGAAGAIPLPAFERVWRGLPYDAERYPDLEPIQSLMRAESALRALTRRPELTWVAPATPATR